MNYRHAYHAGNFADVLKHIVLSSCLKHLARKDAPFRVIDTHAGAGRYRLDRDEAAKTGEWQAGIGRLLGPDAKPLPAEVAAVIAPYLECLRRWSGAGPLTVYPGSPVIAQTMLRSIDRLVANELHRDDAKALEAALGRDRRVKVLNLDGWIALKSLLPPRERRGLVLIDPPFEEPGELIRITEGVTAALDRFATGIYLLWYPIKDPKPVARFHRALAELKGVSRLRAELMIRPARNPEVLNGAGLVIVNPPFTLEAELRCVLPALSERLAQAEGAGFRLDWIE